MATKKNRIIGTLKLFDFENVKKKFPKKEILNAKIKESKFERNIGSVVLPIRK